MPFVATLCGVPGWWLGKSPWLQSVWLESEVAIGDLVQSALSDAGPNLNTGLLPQPALA